MKGRDTPIKISVSSFLRFIANVGRTLFLNLDLLELNTLIRSIPQFICTAQRANAVQRYNKFCNFETFIGRKIQKNSNLVLYRTFDRWLLNIIL